MVVNTLHIVSQLDLTLCSLLLGSVQMIILWLDMIPVLVNSIYTV